MKVKASPTIAERDKGAFRAFITALSTPSGLSVATMLVVLTGLLLAFVLFVQWAATAGRVGLFAWSSQDHPAFVSDHIAGLSDQPGDPPLLAILGASATRASFGNNAEIAEAYKARTGQVIEVVNLCTGRQPILTHLALIENLPRNRPVTVLVGLGPSRFTIDRDQLQKMYNSDTHAFSSPMKEKLAREIGLDPKPDTGVALFDDSIFYVSRATALAKNFARFLLQGRPVQQDEEQFIGRKPRSLAAVEAHSDVVAERFEDADEAIAMNLAVLRQLIALVKDRPNMRLVLLDDPINPAFIANRLGQARFDEHLAFMRAITEPEAIPYWTLAVDLGLSPDVFHDWAHISSDAAQTAMRNALIDRLAELGS